MKKTVLIIAALAASLSLRAEEAPQSSYSVSVDFPYASKYVFRGVQLAEGTFQPSVEVAFGDFAIGLWTAQPVTSNIDNEIDLYASYGIALNDAWSIDTGLTLYYYPELDTSTGADRTTWEPYIGLTGEVGGFSPGVYLYYDATLKVFTYQGQLGYSVALEPAGASLDFSAALGRVDPNGGGGYTYYSFGLSVPFTLSESATFTVGVNYTGNDITGGDGFGKKSHFYGTAGITIGF
ncbi:MAG TPA: TorF family putative porin [Opitutaceae bacterium]|nr:TorF family putative porin [Opitutaceae bacterium]HRJ46687.1 TorF family putative porin [Opitutaceae bacterium]